MHLDHVASQQVLEEISRHCPECLGTYIHCMNRVNHCRQAFFNKKMVTEEMSESWVKFRNNLKKLTCENLLEWHPFNGGIMVTLVPTEE